MYLNKAMIIGNLTRDPEIKSLPSGQKVCNFSVATNRVYKDSSGNKQESVDYHNIVVWGATADNSARYLKKGSQVFVEGRLTTRSWDGPDGKKNYRTEIVADTVTFGTKATGGEGGGAGYSPRPSAPSMPASNAKGDDEFSGGAYEVIDFGEDPNPDDIPF